MRLKIYKSRNGEWRWTIYAKNSRKIACSGEGYRRRVDCERMGQRVFESVK